MLAHGTPEGWTFTGVAPTGPDAIFEKPEVDALVAALDAVRSIAVAS